MGGAFKYVATGRRSTHETYFSGMPKMVGAGSWAVRRFGGGAKLTGELFPECSRIGDGGGSRGDGCGLRSAPTRFEDEDERIRGYGRWYMAGDGGAEACTGILE